MQHQVTFTVSAPDASALLDAVQAGLQDISDHLEAATGYGLQDIDEVEQSAIVEEV
jgi:hypothetical protein